MGNFLFHSKSSYEGLPKIGGKALNLYLMDQERIPIPKWICITSDLFLKYFEENKEFIFAKIYTLSLENPSKAKMISNEIEEIFKKIVFSQKEESDILESLDEEKLYAVRSSAIGEDGEYISYAGQLESFLFVEKKDIIKRIKECWASYFSERNIQYRFINQVKEFSGVAVIIQEMVDAQKAGVMFTAHPLLHEKFLDEIVISAGFGVGEGVVKDLVEVDTYTFSKSKKVILDTNYEIKKTKVVRGESGKPEKVSLSPEFQNVSVLTQGEVQSLAGLGVQIRKFFGTEQDIEWCIDKSSMLYITQSRPITTLRKGVNKLDFFFDNSNVVESFPGVNTPWTLGQIEDIYSISFKRACLRIGLNRKEVHARRFIFENLIGIHQGRVFYNLSSWYSMMRLIPFTESYIKVWEESLGVPTSVREFTNSSQANFSFKKIIELSRICFSLGYHLIFMDRWGKKLERELESLFSNYWSQEKRGEYLAYTPGETIRRMEDFKAQLFQDSDLTLINDIFAFVFTGLAKHILKKQTRLNPEITYNQLLLGLGEMESLYPLKKLNELVQMVEESPELKKSLTLLGKLPEYNKLHAKYILQDNLFIDEFEDYLSLYGDRGISELKFETKTYREDPIELIKLILSYAKDKKNNADPKKENNNPGDTLLEVKSELSSIWFFLFRISLKLGIRSVNFRESFRLQRSRAYGILRRMSLNLGRKMATIGDIEQPEDIWFLHKVDVHQRYTGRSFHENLKEKVKLNKKVYRNFKKVEVGPQYTIRQGVFQEIPKKKEELSCLKGTPCSGGIIEGEVLVISNIENASMDTTKVQDKILVAPMTDPGWVFLMAASKGLIVEKGSILSHTAIIGRELGVPTIVGVKGCVEYLRTGDLIKMNALTGEITVINKLEGV